MNTYPRQGSQPTRLSNRPAPQPHICLSCAAVVQEWDVTGAGGHSTGTDHCGPVITTKEILRDLRELKKDLKLIRRALRLPVIIESELVRDLEARR